MSGKVTTNLREKVRTKQHGANSLGGSTSGMVNHHPEIGQSGGDAAPFDGSNGGGGGGGSSSSSNSRPALNIAQHAAQNQSNAPVVPQAEVAKTSQWQPEDEMDAKFWSVVCADIMLFQVTQACIQLLALPEYVHAYIERVNTTFILALVVSSTGQQCSALQITGQIFQLPRQLHQAQMLGVQGVGTSMVGIFLSMVPSQELTDHWAGKAWAGQPDGAKLRWGSPNVQAVEIRQNQVSTGVICILVFIQQGIAQFGVIAWIIKKKGSLLF